MKANRTDFAPAQSCSSRKSLASLFNCRFSVGTAVPKSSFTLLCEHCGKADRSDSPARLRQQQFVDGANAERLRSLGC